MTLSSYTIHWKLVKKMLEDGDINDVASMAACMASSVKEEV
jgi:hypothetical protein